MKICLIADTHFGVRNNNRFFQEYQKEFFIHKFLPYLKKNNINTVIHLGDLCDKRKYIDYTSLSIAKDCFVSMLVDNDIFLHLLVGNHDSYYKSDSSVISSKLLFDYYEKDKKIRIYDHIDIVDIDGVYFMMCPWLYKDNMDTSLSMIKNSSVDVCCGHFEIKGALQNNRHISKKGINKGIFSNIPIVFSGHFHKPSDVYVGSPYQMTWSDAEDDKRIIIFDTESLSYESVCLSDPIFKIIDYDDNIDFSSINSDNLKDKIIKININNNVDPNLLEEFMNKLEDSSPHMINSCNDFVLLNDGLDNVNDVSDTLTILYNYIDGMSDLVNGDRVVLKGILEKLYNKVSDNL